MHERDILIAALERGSLQEREAFVAEACGDDVLLRARVDELLDAANRDDSFLERPATDNTALFHGASDSGDELQPKAFLGPAKDSTHLGTLGQYDILERIGSGGMGIVFRAFDHKLNRIVAAKVLAPELASYASARRRFSREAQAAAAVVHPHVITIHSVDEHVRTPYFVMEFVDGQSLAQKIDAIGPLPTKEILRIGSQIAAGLAAAHAQGLIHRDIKPANILLENGIERVKITDFGLARAVDDVRITKSGTVAGTPEYMSPEQARGDDVDYRSDLFSLGCVIYAMSTGRSPFRASSTIAAIRRVCDDAPRPIEEVNTDTPEWLAALVERLLQKNPTDRYQSAAEVADMLGERLANLQQPKRYSESVPLENRRPWPTETFRRRAILGSGVVVIGIAILLCLLPLSGMLESVFSASVSKPVTVNTPKQKPSVPGTIDENEDAATLVVRVRGNGITIELDGPMKFAFETGNFKTLKVLPGSYRVRAIQSSTKKVLRSGEIELQKGDTRLIAPRLFRYMPSTPPLPKSLATCTKHKAIVTAVSYSSDGRSIVSADEKGIIICQQVDGNEQSLLFDSKQGGVSAIAFSPDGRLLISAGYDRTINVWDATTGVLIQHRKTQHGAIQHLEFSSLGDRLASCDDRGRITIWEWDTLAESKNFQAHSGAVARVTFSPDDGKLAAANKDGTATIWDGESCKALRTLHGHTSYLNVAKFSPDGDLLATAGRDSLVTLWDANTGKVHATFAHSSEILDLDFSPDGHTLAVADNQLIRFWDLDQVAHLETRTAHWGWITRIQFSPSGETLVTGSKDFTVKQWSVNTSADSRKDLVETPQPRLAFWKWTPFFAAPLVSFAPDAPNHVAVSGYLDKGTAIWDVELRHIVSTFGTLSTRDVRCRGGNKVMHFAYNSAIQLWDADEQQLLSQIQHGHGTNGPTCVAISRGGKSIAVLRSADFPNTWPTTLLDLETGSSVATIPTTVGEKICGGHTTVACSPTDDLLAVGTAAGFVTLWDSANGKSLGIPLQHGSTLIWSVGFSHDGKLLASASSDSSVKVWNVEDPSVPNAKYNLLGHKGDVIATAFSPDGNLLVSAGGTRNGSRVAPFRHDPEIRIWDMTTGQLLVTFTGHEACVTSAEFSSNGRWLVTSGCDSKALVWDVQQLLEYGKRQSREVDNATVVRER